jgi:hypothetical protein
MTKIVLVNYRAALRRAAEEMYQHEMVDTNMEILEIREVAESYDYYFSEVERKISIENCTWATKEEWIKDKIDEWLEK